MWLSPVIPLAIYLVGWSLCWRGSVWSDLEISSSYECGFASLYGARRSFSLHFFHIAVLFLIFDVEVVVLMMLPEGSVLRGLGAWVVLSFIIILLLGFYHEWREGSFTRPSGYATT